MIFASSFVVFVVFYLKLLQTLFRRLWFLPSTFLIIYCLSIEIPFNAVVRWGRWRNICLRLRVSYSAQIKVKIWTKNGKHNKLQEKQFCKRRCQFCKRRMFFLSSLLLWTKRLFLQKTAFFPRWFYLRQK